MFVTSHSPLTHSDFSHPYISIPLSHPLLLTSHSPFTFTTFNINVNIILLTITTAMVSARVLVACTYLLSSLPLPGHQFLSSSRLFQPWSLYPITIHIILLFPSRENYYCLYPLYLPPLVSPSSFPTLFSTHFSTLSLFHFPILSSHTF